VLVLGRSSVQPGDRLSWLRFLWISLVTTENCSNTVLNRTAPLSSPTLPVHRSQITFTWREVHIFFKTCSWVIKHYKIARHVVSQKQTDVSEVRTASIVREKIINAVRTSETSVCLCETARRHIPGGSHFHTRRRENLKSQDIYQLMKTENIDYKNEYRRTDR
jgi:hypothetical protein